MTAPIRDRGVEAPSRASRQTLAFLADVFADYHPRDFAAVLWDGTEWAPEIEPSFTLVLRQPWSLRSMFWPPKDTTLGEAYLRGDFEVEGDLTAALRLAEHLTSSGRRVGPRQLVRLLALPAPPRAELERPRVVADHYDLSNDLFELFLDSRMQYSCANFASDDEELEAAQARKVDLVCRKLRLEPGERLLDIGCGWGGLIRHAASEYGVDALGITISRNQGKLAQVRLRSARLDERCRIELLDYRTLDGEAAFDKLVSVGMVEHVAPADLLEYFRRAHRLLRPGGVFLLQGIAKPSRRSSKRVGASFMTTYVFPEGELAPLPETLSAAERAGFEVRDVECLRESYELTTSHWRERLEARADDARELVGEQAYRMLRIYLAGCAYNFARGNVTLYQTLLLKTDDGVSGLPLMREDWYG